MLFEAARSEGGQAAVHALLARPIEDLRPIARALDRQLGEQSRRWKDVQRLRDAIAAEVGRRAFRNDVFLRTEAPLVAIKRIVDGRTKAAAKLLK